MQFTKRLREPIKNHEITQSVRIWKSPRVKVGNSYRLAPGFIVIESLREISFEDITAKLARETGFSSLADLLKTAKHGTGEHVYLVKFHYHEKLD